MTSMQRGGDPREDVLVAQLREQLEQSARDLDGATLSRLNRARQAALEAHRRAPHARWLWPAAGAAALACAFAFALWRPLVQPDAMPLAPVAAADLELLAGETGIELYEELEFYAWLDAQDTAQADG